MPHRIHKCTNTLYDYAIIINTYVSLMYGLKKIGKVFTSKSVGTGPSSCEKKDLPGRGLTKIQKHWSTHSTTTLFGDTNTKLGTEIHANWQVGMTTYRDNSKADGV